MQKTSLKMDNSTKAHMNDTYSVKYEEKEMEKRDTSWDTNLCKRKYAELGAIFEQVLKLKKDKSSKSAAELKSKRNEASLMIVLLKKVNRLEKYRIRTGREVLQKEKLRVDNNRLHLQNLLYEISYLKKEIQRCYQFTSCDEYINLVPEEEFYEKAPLSISRPEATKVSEHIKRLAMLEWELQQRKELSLLCEDLVFRKDAEIKKIASTNERLESFGPSLTTLLKATKRLQSILGLDIEKEWEVNGIAKLLPQSLYMLYMKLSSFAQTFCPSLNVTVEGTEDDVRQYESVKGNDVFPEYDQNSDTEEVDAKRSKYVNKSDLMEKKKKMDFEPFPLFIKFSIGRCEEPKGYISIEIRYFPCLGFVTAASSLHMDNLPMTDVISSENILNYLYENDSGDTNPSLRCKYQLHELKTDERECLMRFEENKYGKPYKWAQKLCGLDFVELPKTTDVSKQLAESHRDISVVEIVKKIKLQWSSRLNLYKQLFQLENNSSNIYMKKFNFINVSICSNIAQWSPITWEEYLQKNSNHVLSQKKFVLPGNLLYRAIVKRGTTRLECFVSISPNFPTKSPLWAFAVSSDDRSHSSRDSAIKDMEFWTNSLTQFQLKSKSTLLLSQMVRTLCSFDIFVETELNQQQKLPEFTQDKIMLKAHSKRNRGLPFKYVKNSIFKHL